MTINHISSNQSGVLFSAEVMKSMEVSTTEEILEASAPTPLDVLHFNLCTCLGFTSKYEMPIVNQTQCSIPQNIIAVYRYRSHGYFPANCAGHFYTSDNRFECTWSFPYRELQNILKYPLIIAPDFSVYANLLYPQKLWNIFRNKLLAAWWQYNGRMVIPNVSWINGHYHESFDGWPKSSIIAVNSTGINGNLRCQKMWIEGYNVMLDTLQPTHILRYGAKIPGECEDISTYYENNNKTFAAHGWK